MSRGALIIASQEAKGPDTHLPLQARWRTIRGSDLAQSHSLPLGSVICLCEWTQEEEEEEEEEEQQQEEGAGG